MSADVVSAEEAQKVLRGVALAREIGGMGSDEAAVSVVMENLARTVLTLHCELAVLRAQLGPLCAVHDALVAAAALPGAGASPEAMVAAVRAKASADAREDLARIGRLVGCDSLVGVEIHAAVEHELLERDAARDAAERAERERDDARAEVETLRAEAVLMREQIGQQEVSLSATIGRLREEKAELRTRLDVVGDTQQRIAAAWNQIAGHFLVNPSPANAERIARLACAAADVRDEAMATRDEAVAEVRRLTAALEIARREGAEAMLARCRTAALDAFMAHPLTVDHRHEPGCICHAIARGSCSECDRGDAIMAALAALPLDAPGGA